ncbi:MAG: DUF945 domain-containing protein [Magnetococcales bacterium]|nr:DUF945 domain-containing protein [Magnetococcales bacterium]
MIRYMKKMTGTSITNSAGLTEEQLRRFVPAIFATEPDADRSSSYGFIPTIQVVNSMIGMGFTPMMACQTNARSDIAMNCVRHMIRFSHKDAAHDEHNRQELVLLNSHDGSSSYKLLSGVYRMVCSNGLIAGDTHASMNVRHTSNAAKEVSQASMAMIKGSDGVWKSVQEMQRTHLSRSGLFELGEEAARIAHPTVEIDPEDMVRVRRYADYDPSNLWTGLNIVQENAIRGDVLAARRNSEGHVIRFRTRPIHSVKRSVQINQDLFALAEMVLALT